MEDLFSGLLEGLFELVFEVLAEGLGEILSGIAENFGGGELGTGGPVERYKFLPRDSGD